MTINALTERGELIVSKDDLTGSRWFVEFLRSVFYALFGFKRTFTATKALDFPLIAAQSESSLTVAVVGARAGDAVIVTPDAKTAGIIDNYGLVTANDVVTVYAHNITVAGINPASKNYRVICFQQ